MTLEEVLEHWGWIGVLALWVLPRAWTFATEKWFPRYAKQTDDKEKERAKLLERIEHDKEQAAQAEREARASLLRAQIEREAREDNRQERITVAIEQISISMVTINDRLNSILTGQTQHIQFTLNSHNDMVEKLKSAAQLIQTDQRLDNLERKISDTHERMQAIKVSE